MSDNEESINHQQGSLDCLDAFRLGSRVDPVHALSAMNNLSNKVALYDDLAASLSDPDSQQLDDDDEVFSEDSFISVSTSDESEASIYDSSPDVRRNKRRTTGYPDTKSRVRTSVSAPKYCELSSEDDVYEISSQSSEGSESEHSIDSGPHITSNVGVKLQNAVASCRSKRRTVSSSDDSNVTSSDSSVNDNNRKLNNDRKLKTVKKRGGVIERQSFSRANMVESAYSSDDDSFVQESDDMSDDTSEEDYFSEISQGYEAPPEKVIDVVLGIRDGQFLIKKLHTSYRDVEWIDFEQYPNEQSKLINFTRREEAGKLSKQYYMHGEMYDPDFCIPDRIVHHSEDGTYLVKWTKLNYDQCTWEKPSNIPDFESHEINYNNRMTITKNSTKRKTFQEMKESPSFRNNNTLRSYQLEGLNWLAYNWHKHVNSILADEMGLGKTMQSISLMWYLHVIQGIHGPFLVVVPLSTLANWKREIEKWTDLNVVVYHGNKESREYIRDYEFLHPSAAKKSRTGLYDICTFEVLLTTYEQVVTDIEHLENFKWEMLIVDEAHRLKNRNARLFLKLRLLDYSHCVLLTGTPLQNNITELWNLMHFLEPDEFPSLDEFHSRVGDVENADEAATLHCILKPFLLRRVKEDVEKSLALKQETVIEVELTTNQKQYYKAVYEQNMAMLSGGQRMNLNNVAMQLRKVCNHPFSIEGVEDLEAHKGDDNINDKLIACSGKTMLLDMLLPKLFREGHRVLLFSQFISVLDILEDFLIYRGFRYERFDGTVTGAARQHAIDSYSKEDSDAFVFLLSTRAGGVGINLVSADTVILYDSDWNPQQDLQAQARCHRIGQKKDVKIYRLITRGTYESKMFECASMKLGLDQAVLKAGKQTKHAPNTQEIENLLKYGAYHIFRNDDDAPSMFSNDIESILESNSRTIDIRGACVKSDQPSLFSKASFVSSTADVEVDIDDPDFWSKMGLVEAPKPTLGARNRKTRMTRRETSGNSDCDDSDFSEAQDEFVSDTDIADNDAFLNWTKSQRDTFVKDVLRVGFKAISIEHKTDEEIRVYSGQWLLTTFLAADYSTFVKRSNILFSYWDEYVLPVLSKDINSNHARILTHECLLSLMTGSTIDPSLLASSFSNKTSRNCSSWLTQLNYIWTIQSFVSKMNWSSCSGSAVDEFPEIWAKGRFSSPPTDCWGMQEDRALIQGIAIYGWGQYSEFSDSIGTSDPVILNRRIRNLVSVMMKKIVTSSNNQLWSESTCKDVVAGFKSVPFDISATSEPDWNAFQKRCGKSAARLTLPMFKGLVSTLWSYIQALSSGEATLSYRLPLSSSDALSLLGTCTVLRQLHLRQGSVHLTRYPLARECSLTVYYRTINANTDRTHVPDWWQIPLFDIELIKATSKFGFFSWKRAFTEKSLDHNFKKLIKEHGYSMSLCEKRVSLLLDLPQVKIASPKAKIRNQVKPASSALFSALSASKPKSTLDENSTPGQPKAEPSALDTILTAVEQDPASLKRTFSDDGDNSNPIPKKPKLKASLTQSSIGSFFIQK